MKKTWITILGIISLLVTGTAAAYYIILVIDKSDACLPEGLPPLVIAIFALIAGIFTLRNKSLGWGFGGLTMLIALIIYFGILLASIARAL